MFQVLIAEDDRDLRQLFSRVLEKNGYGVEGVANGREALEALENKYFDIVTLLQTTACKSSNTEP